MARKVLEASKEWDLFQFSAMCTSGLLPVCSQVIWRYGCDATVGTGVDALYLAQASRHSRERVIGFDIQSEALTLASDRAFERRNDDA